MNSKQVGNQGEKIAIDYLKSKGYRILDKNYVFKIPGSPSKGEIDIIAKKKDVISFVEVKTITNIGEGPSSFFAPEEKVNFQKRRKISKIAESWLIKKQILLNSKWQIDIIAIEINPPHKPKISHFENAVSSID
ncbi:MAG: YraN family protein [Candidatus Nealsonbacteria bacterium CG_4_10_14_0_2_um_filter_35_20]|uniref:UPF0102 protein COX38_00330 n=2 Tax=Candidatus Nealsoniibacteriota TaxID=1817911 RepID=A0A2G9YTC8_9BACT|nr:MAG: YraN family protein [Candidatus Nealsonbacteria bacterium CG23_combo_of_CG06-09_8_20_14_all_39_25]PIR02249.1 MAG: YraN family protein [Candidatus Nealsonbacteria bacterium CG11_big_fil_rev_8_21_14_0_20_35_11]PIZ89819.1 MAG: YraN family protein [Candidatus Nealsonbacteria bacterium CG_4_10_14_0_2_um_filter_35_20]